MLLLTDRIDPWFVDSLAEFDGKSLVDVAKAGLELPDKQQESSADADGKEHKALLKKIKRALKDRVAEVNVSRRLVDSPACVVAADNDLNPQLRRMLEASGQALPESRPVLEVNTGHPLLKRLSDEKDKGRFEDLAHVVMDHALLAEGSQLENPAEYVRRINDLMLEINAGGQDEA